MGRNLRGLKHQQVHPRLVLSSEELRNGCQKIQGMTMSNERNLDYECVHIPSYNQKNCSSQ